MDEPDRQRRVDVDEPAWSAGTSEIRRQGNLNLGRRDGSVRFQTTEHNEATYLVLDAP